eukprot:2630992-Rhodomonas_salina.3
MSLEEAGKMLGSHMFSRAVLLLAIAVCVEGFSSPLVLNSGAGLRLRSAQKQCSSRPCGLRSLGMMTGSEAAQGAGVTTSTVSDKAAAGLDQAVAAASSAATAAGSDQVVGPAVQVVGKSFSGMILIAVPILGGIVVFSAIAWIIANTFYVNNAAPLGEQLLDRKSNE